MTIWTRGTLHIKTSRFLCNCAALAGLCETRSDLSPEFFDYFVRYEWITRMFYCNSSRGSL